MAPSETTRRPEVIPASAADCPPMAAATATILGLTRAEELTQQRRLRRQEKCERVLDLRRQKVRFREIARRLGLHRGTVRTYARAASFPERARRRYPRETDRFLDYLRQRCQAGCHNAATLAAELREQGFRGSEQMVRRCVAVWRKRGPAGASSAAAPARQCRPSSKRVAWVLLKPEAEREVKGSSGRK